MNATHFHLVITVDHDQTTVVVLENVSPEEKIAAIVREVLRRLGLAVDEPGWCLELRGTPLPSESLIRVHISALHAPVELILRRATPVPAAPHACVDEDEEGKDVFEETNFDAPALSEAVALDNADTDLEASDFELSLDEDSDSDLASGSQVVALDEEEVADDPAATIARPCKTKPATTSKIPADEDQARSRAKKTATRRTTVRYYSRMNPERVYPLIVMITRNMVEKVRKKDTDQRASGPFKIDVDTPVEIEPVLPGCDCHPPKVTARLGQGDLTLTFRVVPRVLGRVDGAVVSIRQDHASLAEVELEVKVVKQTWVILTGAATFLLPGLSAVMKHFRLDFETQKEQGFSLYLAAARLVFDRVTPLALTALLGLATAFLWWFTRPRTRDVFWDVEKVGPGEKLKRIAAAMASNEDKVGEDLLELLKAFPDYQPARLFYAECHYNTENYRAALKGYERAFKLGVAKAQHYHKASLAAAKLGQNERALQILQTADELLSAREMTSVMLYNMGCYHVRLGDLDEAVACLRRAVEAGYHKRASYLKDPDLARLRGRSDFKQLIARLGKAGT